MKNKILYIVPFVFLFEIFGSNLTAKDTDSSVKKDIHSLKALVTDIKNNLPIQIIDSTARKEIQNLQISIQSSKNLSQIADTVIMWSAMIIAFFSILLIAAGFYTTIRVNEIRKIKIELELLQSKSAKNLEENKILIAKLNTDFENESKIQMKLIFPLIKAENNIQEGNYYKAFYRYNEAKSISPNHPWLINFIWLLINTGRYEEAIRYLNGQLERDPENNDVKYYLAHVYRRQGLLEKAEKLIEPVATESKHALSLYEYATILFAKGQFKKAEHIYKEANGQHLLPDLFTYLNLSITQIINNNLAEAKENGKIAKELITKALLKNPNNPHLLLQIGIVLLITNSTGGVSKIKLSIKNDLLSENAKSAIFKLNLLPNPSQEIQESINILQKYYGEA